MLDSVKIQRRQSEIRTALTELVGKDTPTDDETRSIEAMDTEYRANETKYRAALTLEDHERREAGEELETRSSTEWDAMVDNFQLRQVANHYAENAPLSGQTHEVVTELRSQGGYQGVPVPWQALEKRVGETTSATTPNPVRTMPLIDRLFPQSVAAQLGGSLVNVGTGNLEYPISTAQTAVGWQANETADVGAPTAFTIMERQLKPDHTMGVQMKVTRKALKQSGEGMESAIRRDMSGAMGQELDRVLMLGSGAAGEPNGIVANAAGYGVTETALGAAADWAAFRKEILAFMLANAATGPGSVRMLCRPEIWDRMDGSYITGTAVTEWSLMQQAMLGVVMSTNALEAPAGGSTTAVMSTSAGGIAPFFIGSWGAIDLIRDPYSDAASGGLRLTALTTMDVTVSRAEQLRVVSDIQ